MAERDKAERKEQVDEQDAKSRQNQVAREMNINKMKTKHLFRGGDGGGGRKGGTL